MSRVITRSGLVLCALFAGGLATVPTAGTVAGFGDVPAGQFYTNAVQWMVDNDITTGTSPTCFSPSDAVTRGQAAAFMWRMEGEPDPGAVHPFVDVLAAWQQNAVSWMFNNGITTGTTATTYSPDDVLTRGQMAALVHRLAGEPQGSPPHPFTDVLRAWQQSPVSWMADEGITTGTSPTTFSPDHTVTRGQLATFFHRYKGSPVVVVDPRSPFCGPVPPNPGDAVDCDDFATQAEAQAWFDTYFIHYGDVANLDSDNDGMACEEPPPPPSTTTLPQNCHPAYSPCLPNLAGDALNCGDLTAAQKPVTVLVPGVDPYNLDSDDDGTGCESG